MNSRNYTKFISRILVAAVIFIAGLFQSCTDRGNTYLTDHAESVSRYYYIDTLDIHGVKHEFIYSAYKYNSGGLAMSHSPECWCLKEKVHDKVDSRKIDEEYVKKKFIDWLFQEDNSQRIDIWTH